MPRLLGLPSQPSDLARQSGYRGRREGLLNVVDTTSTLPKCLDETGRSDWHRRFGTQDALAASLNYHKSIFAGVRTVGALSVAVEDLVLTVPVMTIAGAFDEIALLQDNEAGTKAWASDSYTAHVGHRGHGQCWSSRER